MRAMTKGRDQQGTVTRYRVREKTGVKGRLVTSGAKKKKCGAGFKNNEDKGENTLA